MEKAGSLVGRVLMGLIFVLSGLFKLIGPGRMAIFMSLTPGLSRVPYELVLAMAVSAGVIEFFGGLLLMIGFHARVVAVILFLFLIPVTILFHIIPGGQVNQVNTMKNLAIMGGLLMIATLGAGGLSLDARARSLI